MKAEEEEEKEEEKEEETKEEEEETKEEEEKTNHSSWASQSTPASRSSCRPSTQNKHQRTSDDHSGVLIAAAEDVGILEVT
jgi:hypothetical protein